MLPTCQMCSLALVRNAPNMLHRRGVSTTLAGESGNQSERRHRGTSTQPTGYYQSIGKQVVQISGGVTNQSHQFQNGRITPSSTGTNIEQQCGSMVCCRRRHRVMAIATMIRHKQAIQVECQSRGIQRSITHVQIKSSCQHVQDSIPLFVA